MPNDPKKHWQPVMVCSECLMPYDGKTPRCNCIWEWRVMGCGVTGFMLFLIAALIIKAALALTASE